MKLKDIDKFIDELLTMKGLFGIDLLVIYKEDVIRSADMVYQARAIKTLLYLLDDEGEAGRCHVDETIKNFMADRRKSDE